MRMPLLLSLLAIPPLGAMDPAPAEQKTPAGRQGKSGGRVEIHGQWGQVAYEGRLSKRTLRFQILLPELQLAFSQNGMAAPILAVKTKGGTLALPYTDIETSGPALMRFMGEKGASLPAHLDKAEEVGRKAAASSGDRGILAQVEEWADALAALRWALVTTETPGGSQGLILPRSRILQELKLGDEVELHRVESKGTETIVLHMPWFQVSAPLHHFKALDAPKASPVEMSAGHAIFRLDSLDAFHRKQADLVRQTLSPSNQASLAETLRQALETLWRGPARVSGSTLGRIAGIQIKGLYRHLKKGADTAAPAPEAETPWTIPILKPTLGTKESLVFTDKAGATFVRAPNGDLLATLWVEAFALQIQDRKDGREAWMTLGKRETPRRAMPREDDEALFRASPDLGKDFQALVPELGAGFRAALDEALGQALDLLDDPAWSRTVVEPLLFRMVEVLQALG